jgi:hypothetical protein
LELLPRGDGSYTAKPVGKPQQWWWVREAAEFCRVSPAAVRAWAREGLIVSRRAGRRKYQVEAESLQQFLEPYNHLR